MTPKQKICNPPKKHSKVIMVVTPFGELLKKIFSQIVSIPTKNAKTAIKKPKPATILNGKMLKEVIPLRASPISDIKLNFD